MMRNMKVRTVVVGSGCAGLNTADWLYSLGERDILLVTEGMNMGTSRNTGSDKQTYYKLSLAGSDGDSPQALANTLFAEGVHGDIALAEAAGSAQAFLRLVQLGVPFPCNAYGEYIGYQTDHDTRMRATSAGPLTSKFMTEALESQVRAKDIPILDHTMAFHLVVHEGELRGLICYDQAAHELISIACAHVVLATGGPAQIYWDSVFPQSQTGMSGMALFAGAKAANLHQWQYGLASTDFRWNVSGSYQQVLPRYISVDENGIEREFLAEAMDPLEAVRLCFLKGYQWPFDVQKTEGSSLVDLLVHRETAVRGRRVYMDFRRNPFCLNESFDGLDEEALQYLKRSGCMQSTPFERLQHMNAPAIALYQNHGIDIEHEPLAVAVCAQHCNGGMAVDVNWQTNIAGLYAAGEAAGTFGAYRPGGSALNATQVGSMRAAQHIAWDSKRQASQEAMLSALAGTELLCMGGNIEGIAQRMQRHMSAVGAHLRDTKALHALSQQVHALLARCVPLQSVQDQQAQRLKLRDLLLTQAAVIDAMLFSAEACGSTGAGLVMAAEGTELGAGLGYQMKPKLPQDQSYVLTTTMQDTLHTEKTPARPIPQRDNWFETVWRTYRQRTHREDRKEG